MDAIKFIEYYNIIKPNIEEIENSLSAEYGDIANEIHRDFDLKLISLDRYQEPIFDIIRNTNISKTRFSVFHFNEIFEDLPIARIGSIEEKATIYFNSKSKSIFFEDLYPEKFAKPSQGIQQIEFLEIFLKYLESYFGMVFRKNSINKPTIDEIKPNLKIIKQNSLFQDLFFEVGLII